MSYDFVLETIYFLSLKSSEIEELTVIVFLIFYPILVFLNPDCLDEALTYSWRDLIKSGLKMGFETRQGVITAGRTILLDQGPHCFNRLQLWVIRWGTDDGVARCFREAIQPPGWGFLG